MKGETVAVPDVNNADNVKSTAAVIDALNIQLFFLSADITPFAEEEKNSAASDTAAGIPNDAA